MYKPSAHIILLCSLHADGDGDGDGDGLFSDVDYIHRKRSLVNLPR